MDLIDTLLRPFRINSSRKHLKIFLLEAASKMNKGNLVLDAGAGDGKYQEIFNHCNYHSTDIRQVKPYIQKVSYRSNLDALPITAHQYDLAICNQVLEHVPKPQQIVDELFRVLKENGELWLTAPLYYEEHDTPNDYFRFTQYGMSLLIESAGFKIKRIDGLEGYFGTLSYELKKAARSLPINPRKLGNPIIGLPIALLNVVLKPAFFFLSLVYSYVDIAYKHQSSGNCKNYSVVAVKPESHRSWD